MTALPAWIDSRFRIIDGGRIADVTALSAAADALERRFRAGPRRVVVPADSAENVAAALIAAERSAVELVLKRDGEVVPDAEGACDGFSVLLQTSGTTGVPKLIRHDFDALRGRLRGTGDPSARWLLAYDPASFAGLQVMLTAAAGGATLVAAAGKGVVGLARAAAEHGATHVSATPSLWRALLMAFGPDKPPLRALTLGGEAVDQPLLDRLRSLFPEARLRHIYASTEAGALFAVTDAQAGFPSAWLETGIDDVLLRIRNGILEVNSPRAMKGRKGMWLDTGDLVEVVGNRVFFVGRTDGRVNVGGVKVSPEAVERRLQAVPGVADVLVEPVANPITGFLLTAIVVPEPGYAEADLRVRLRAVALQLESAARPRVVTFMDMLPISATGKKLRRGES